MKKALMTALMLLFASSLYAGAATFSMTGDATFQGNYWGNWNPVAGNDDEGSFGYYESDINLYPKITVGDTSLNFKVAVTDHIWGAAGTASTWLDSDNNEIGVNGQSDDVINIERAWLKHKFNDMLTIDVGLQDGTQWGTTFGDDKTARWRVKFTETTKLGVFGQVLEKITDNGAVRLSPAGENDDSDNYGLFWVGKVGNIYIKPLIFYCDSDGALNDVALPGTGEKSFTRLNLVLALNGDVGVSFETEFNYNKFNATYDAAGIDEDWSNWGFYFNVWKALDAMTPGFTFAYGTQDDDEYTTLSAGPLAALAYYTAFDFEDDFNSTAILGDMYYWGGDGAGDDLQGMTLLKAYVNDIKTPVAKLTANAYFAYVMSNQKDTNYEDATAWELGVGANYKITDNLSYHPYAAYADISYDVTGIPDPKSTWLLAHALEFSF